MVPLRRQGSISRLLVIRNGAGLRQDLRQALATSQAQLNRCRRWAPACAGARQAAMLWRNVIVYVLRIKCGAQSCGTKEIA